MKLLTPPVRPYRGTRGTDAYGSGTFLASRDGGSRSHIGRDYVAQPGDEAVFPIDGVVERIGLAYPDDSALRSIHIRGTGEHSGVLVKLLYANCDHAVGTKGAAGDRLGTAQDVATRYPGITGHLHLEVYVALDPDPLMAKPPQGGPVA